MSADNPKKKIANQIEQRLDSYLEVKCWSDCKRTSRANKLSISYSHWSHEKNTHTHTHKHTCGSCPLPDNSSSPLGSQSSRCRWHSTISAPHRVRHVVIKSLVTTFLFPSGVPAKCLLLNAQPECDLKKEMFVVFTSPGPWAFLLARACLLSLRSLAHRSASLSPVLASTSGTKPDSKKRKSNI